MCCGDALDCSERGRLVLPVHSTSGEPEREQMLAGGDVLGDPEAAHVLVEVWLSGSFSS